MLIVHIAAGTISLLADAAAMVFRKGGDGHRVSGQVFVGSMLVLALTGAVVGVSRGQVLLAVPLGVAARLGFYGLEAANSETGMLGGFSATGMLGGFSATG